MPLAEASDVSRTPPARKTKTKPRKPKRFRSLSDPRTLSELALRLKEGIYITTLDGEIVDANPAFLEMFGVESLEDLKHYRTSDFVKPEVRAREMAQLEREGSVRDIEFQLTRRDGKTRTVVDSAFLSIDPESGEKYCHGILVDITHRKELQTQLLELSIRDPLTGCYNRRYLNTVTRQCEAQPRGEWGCIYLDIDHFKQYNDRNGHAEGDAVLVKMARFWWCSATRTRIRPSMSSTDCVRQRQRRHRCHFRWGGRREGTARRSRPR